MAKTLKPLGVEALFGQLGHGDLSVLGALIDSGTRFISVHHR